MNATSNGDMSIAIGYASYASEGTLFSFFLFPSFLSSFTAIIAPSESNSLWTKKKKKKRKKESMVYNHPHPHTHTHTHTIAHHGAYIFLYTHTEGGVAIGMGAVVNNRWGVAIGRQVVASANNAAIFGRCNKINPKSASITLTSFGANEELFVVGNGGWNVANLRCQTRTNAMALYKNGNLEVAGSVTTTNVITPSDSRFKSNVTPLQEEQILEKVQQMRPVKYSWKQDEELPFTADTEVHIGLIAQEVRQVFPELVREDQPSGYLSVNYGQLGVIALQAIKDQQQIINDQQKAINDQQKVVNDQQKVINEITKEMDEMRSQIRQLMMSKQ